MSKASRKKLGRLNGPMAATRVLVMDMETKHFRGIKSAQALLIIDDTKGTVTSAQTYDGNLGANYDPEGSNLIRALPVAGDSRWREWEKRGYTFQPVENFDFLTPVEVGEPATSQA